MSEGLIGTRPVGLGTLIHRNKMQCRAITTKNTQCTRKAVGNDCYCTTQVFGDKPPSTPRIDGWYSSSIMKVPPASDHNRRALIRALRDAGGPIQRRIRFLTLTEYFLKYPEQATQNNVETCLSVMGEGNHLAYYREYFARKLSHRHRQEAKQKMVKIAESIITESELGQDIAGVIASFL